MSKKWYCHVLLRVMDGKGNAHIAWEHDFQTDRVIEHRRLDIIVVNITQKACQISDKAIPPDYHIIIAKQIEKIQQLLCPKC